MYLYSIGMEVLIFDYVLVQHKLQVTFHMFKDYVKLGW